MLAVCVCAEGETSLISVNDMLNFIYMNDLNHIYANLAIALAVPIAVATAERSFSKLKLIKILTDRR